jgi:hypothetical protein
MDALPAKRKRSETRHRQRQLTIRLDADEWRMLQTRAEQAGVSLAGYSRAVLLSAKPLRASRKPSVDTVQLAQTLAQLGKIGGNINQLAKLAHLGGWPDRADLAAASAAVRQSCDAILRALGFTLPVTEEASRDPQGVAA